jgi:hypothetical protein
MEKIISPLIDKTINVIKATRAAIMPFTELPDDERAGTNTSPEKKINAAELFSFFTADIIKEEVVFTR